MERRLEIDALRGLMLVWMTLVHVPTLLTPWVNQPVGFLSASEGFIFLSALFTGRIYYRLLSREGPRAMQRKLLLRTARLYAFHVGLLLLLFVVAARIASGDRTPALYNLLHFYFAAGPGRAVPDSLMLIYRPPLLDIIPLYITFLFLSPFVLLITGRRARGWKYLLAASALIWLGAQLGLGRTLYAALAHDFNVRVPINEMGAFNLWAWQFMWIFGMWCGVRWARDELPVQRWAARAWIPGVAVALVLLAARYAQLLGVDIGPSALYDKWHLGVARLVDFAAVAAILVRFRDALEPLAARPLVMMGQASLYVFCAHFVFCFAGLALSGSSDHVAGWLQFALLAVTFAALLGVARLFMRAEISAPPRPARAAAGPLAAPAVSGAVTLTVRPGRPVRPK
ncbi:MAG TPA: OpgC domain-containing protein [Steroidobacteraceae bacterium]|nr:OpgC domain-containing protein [Steroidobacteraceae bacterium]